MLTTFAQADEPVNSIVDEAVQESTVVDPSVTSYNLVSPPDSAYSYTYDPTYSWISLAIGVLYIVAMWKIFTKAKQPGWASIVPIYNAYVLLKTVGRPGWWLLLYLIPLVNIIVHLIVSIDLGKVFGKGTGFSIVALFFLPFIGYPMLAFGKAEYKGVAPESPAAPAAPAAPTPPAAPTA